MKTIGLIGDYDDAVLAHQAIPLALELAATALNVALNYEWVPTLEIQSAKHLHTYQGLWCVPGSPYHHMEGALCAIQYEREQGLPFLGTCGGFQHAIVEYARNVLGWTDADHAETAPEAVTPVITALTCSLIEVSSPIWLSPGSKIAAAYGREKIVEGYRCSYGLNSAFAGKLLSGPLQVTARDEAGEVRGVELAGHPFFVATLFQPERTALREQLPPLVKLFCASIYNPNYNHFKNEHNS